MKTPRSLLLVPALLLLSSSAFATANVQSTRIFLTRPLTLVPDLDAKGSVLVRSWNGGDRERFDVHVHNVLGSATLALWIADEEDEMTFIADLAGGKTKHWTADTAKSETLPLDETLAGLAGHRVEVRLGEEILLETVVPAFVDDAEHKSATEVLDVAADSPNSGVHGGLIIKGNDQRGLQYLHVKAKGIGFNSFVYTVWIENDLGDMVEVGPIEQYSPHKGRLIRNTRAGSPLPLGVLYVSEIIGRKIEVRDQNDAVYLEEVVPPLQ